MEMEPFRLSRSWATSVASSAQKWELAGCSGHAKKSKKAQNTRLTLGSCQLLLEALDLSWISLGGCKLTSHPLKFLFEGLVLALPRLVRTDGLVEQLILLLIDSLRREEKSQEK